MPNPSHPNLLVGISTGDDAAVWRVDEHRALVATVDFFTPVVDDAFTWGAIAAANSVSDVYAMGGRPLFALNVAAWPRDQLDFDLLGDVLAGAASVAEGRWMIAGGHTVDGPEPMFGQSVTGEVQIEQLMTNNAGQPGDVLVLTKPLGAGTITTAINRCSREDASNGWLFAAASAAISSMTRLNDVAAKAATAAGVRAATDVTGFGLAGHLHKLVLASGVEAHLEFDQIPLLPQTRELLGKGFVPGGTTRNLEFVDPFLEIAAPRVGETDTRLVVADPQTSGGLLLCVRPDRLDDLRAELLANGDLASVVGELAFGTPGRITIR